MPTVDADFTYITEAADATEDLQYSNDNVPNLWNAGQDKDPIPPRGWLLGVSFCRQFVSGLIAQGAAGKSSLRQAQLLSLATGRPLTGEHVHHRARVLVVSLEDGPTELRRRIAATMKYHQIPQDEIDENLYLWAPAPDEGKLLEPGEDGTPEQGTLGDTLKKIVPAYQIDVVSLDPFVKLHALEENSNSAMDEIMNWLADFAQEYNIAVDIVHHARKGMASPGDADQGRGASSIRDAARLVYTLNPMTQEEAQAFSIDEKDRGRYIRLDSAKANLSPPAQDASWFRLVGVNLDNGTRSYPAGDTVGTVEPWTPPDAWDGLSESALNTILDEIAERPEPGEYYTDSGTAGTDRAAWAVVQQHAPDKSKDQCKRIIRAWVNSGVLIRSTYYSPRRRKTLACVVVNDAKRPG